MRSSWHAPRRFYATWRASASPLKCWFALNMPGDARISSQTRAYHPSQSVFTIRQDPQIRVLSSTEPPYIFVSPEYVRFTKRLLFGAFQFCNSPLTNMLRDYFGERPDLYARAVLHLYDLLEGNAESLIGMSQLSAWKILSERYPKAFPEIC
jgi:hypothetical protein